MSMFRIVPVIAIMAVAALVASCNKDQQATPAVDTAAVPQQQQSKTAPVSKPVPAPAGQKGADMLVAAGLEFDFGHEVLYDILDTSKNGTPRHRVLLEVLDGDFADAVDKLGMSMEDMRCTKTSDSNTAGRIQQIFKCEEGVTYYLLMQPAGMGPKLAHPTSVGSIHVMWTAL